MFNYFKEKYYSLNINPNKVIGMLKSETLSSNRLANSGTVFKGEFRDNNFKIQIKTSGNIFIHQSYNPVFFGKVTEADGHTELAVKMRPNWAGYIFAIVPAVVWCFLLACILITGTKDLASFLAFTIIFLGFEAHFFKMSRLAHNEMNELIKEMFCNNLI